MFDIDNWAEIFSTIKKNKMRTFLTGFSISWGIFMFCVLLAAGNGLRNGMQSGFGDRSVNSVQYWGRTTSMPYKGFPDNRPIRLDSKDLKLIEGKVPEADKLSGMIFTDVNANYGTRNTSSSFVGINIDYKGISGLKIKDNQGRFLNEMDIKEKRKVAVINQRLKEILFGDENPVGKLFIAGNLGYRVIGVYEESSWRDGAQAYIPVSTAQLLYREGYGYDNIAFTLKGLTSKEENKAFEESFRGKLSVLHFFDPKDERPIGIWNQLQNYLEFLGIFNGITAFIWIIGVGTLIAGIIGVSNIMLITVRERTREFGIRKALGAKPSSILGSIIMESVFITSLFGYIGMFLGVGLGELVSSVLESPGMEEATRMFKNPTIDVGVAISAMLVLILSGVLAGYFPALKAVRVSAVEAMRAE
ncbi:MAG: ABC transporter permease [Dysgonamonadaceae bacterium]|jgi:putative ABC transport system permease protein|nr:ABC transporter permease [Dysgonamonadaceae bacterium]